MEALVLSFRGALSTSPPQFSFLLLMTLLRVNVP